MKRKYQWTAVIAAVLLASILLSAVLSAQATEDINHHLQYGNPTDREPEELSALDFFELLFDVTPSEAERTYLEQLSSLTLTYSATSAVLGDGISAFFDKETNYLKVVVKSYTYTAENGETVEWIPQSARIELNGTLFEHSFAHEDGFYTASFSEIYHSGDFDVEVTFAWEEEVSEEVAEALLNDAYRAGREALDVILEDEAKQADYDARLAAYEAYQEYLRKKKEFDDYTVALRFHTETALPAYRDYQASVSSYQADTEAYEEWQRYFNVISSGATFEDYVKYQNYLLQIDRIKQRLNVLEVLFLKDSNNWHFYDSLMGGSVTAALLGNKDKLDAAGYKNEVQAAEESTVALRTLMKGYSDLRDAQYASEHDKTVALYRYYLANYTALCNNFVKLTDALYTFLCSPSISSGIKLQGGEKRFAHYEQFVALLYTTSTALDDGVKRPEQWGYAAGNYTAFLDAEILVSDNNKATPAEADIPAAEVPFVDWMDAPPSLPQIMKKPVLENYLSDAVKAYLAEYGKNSLDQEPKAPKVVEDPNKGTVPASAEHPGTAPTPTQIDTRLRNLASEVRAGRLRERSLTDSTPLLRLVKRVEKLVSSVENKRVIIFYSYDRQTVLDRQVLEYGQSFAYQGPESVYTREPSDSHTYKWHGWFLADGETRAEMVATSDLSLYPQYEEKIRFYPVTWILDGVSSTAEVKYGTFPKCPFQTNKAPDERYTYTFSGWRAEGAEELGVNMVTGAVTYVGSITRTPRPYTVTWDLGDRTESVSVPYGERPAYSGVPQRAPDKYTYNFLGWDKPLDWVSGDVTYVAEWEKTGLATSIDGTTMEILHTESEVTVVATHSQVDIREAAKLAQASGKSLSVQWDQFRLTVENAELGRLTAGGCRRVHLIERREAADGIVYTFGYFNSAGQEQSIDISATLCGVTLENESPLVGYLLENGEWRSVGTESIAVKGGASFRLNRTYQIEFLNADKCNIASFPEQIAVGTRVDLRLGCVFGYEISAARVTMEDGTEVAVEGLSFLMPSGNVSVELTVTPILYHVTFVSDGVVIAEGDYLLGEKITLPADPTKPSDGVYDYTFGGWSQDITVAYGDDRNPIYEAVFSATPIAVYQTKLSVIDIILLIVLPIVGGLALVGGGVLITLRVIKKKKVSASVAIEPESEVEEAADTKADKSEAFDEETSDGED